MSGPLLTLNGVFGMQEMEQAAALIIRHINAELVRTHYAATPIGCHFDDRFVIDVILPYGALDGFLELIGRRWLEHYTVDFKCVMHYGSPKGVFTVSQAFLDRIREHYPDAIKDHA